MGSGICPTPPEGAKGTATPPRASPSCLHGKMWGASCPPQGMGSRSAWDQDAPGPKSKGKGRRPLNFKKYTHSCMYLSSRYIEYHTITRNSASTPSIFPPACQERGEQKMLSGCCRQTRGQDPAWPWAAPAGREAGKEGCGNTKGRLQGKG